MGTVTALAVVFIRESAIVSRSGAWRIGLEFVERIYAITQTFPQEERYGLTAQLRRAAIAVPIKCQRGATAGTKGAPALPSLPSAASRKLRRNSNWLAVFRWLARTTSIRSWHWPSGSDKSCMGCAARYGITRNEPGTQNLNPEPRTLGPALRIPAPESRTSVAVIPFPAVPLVHAREHEPAAKGDRWTERFIEERKGEHLASQAVPGRDRGRHASRQVLENLPEPLSERQARDRQ